MNLVLDACSIIYAINGGVLHLLPQMPGRKFYIGKGLLETEILKESQRIMIESLVNNGSLSIIEDEIDVSEFTEISDRYNIGYGETECIILAKSLNLHMVTDDKKAGKSGLLELGESKVIDTITLITDLVQYQLINCQEAFAVYGRIISSGSFLPSIQPKHFC